MYPIPPNGTTTATCMYFIVCLLVGFKSTVEMVCRYTFRQLAYILESWLYNNNNKCTLIAPVHTYRRNGRQKHYTLCTVVCNKNTILNVLHFK
jgi:hypothetical protein